MCAIAGIVGLPVQDESILHCMLETMIRRGPDDNGIYQTVDCTLLHARLAIIDPAGGAQPMHLHWGGEVYTLVYNGELYNTNELRNQLQALGHKFQGRSDTEVVLHAYAQWSQHCVDHFNGIFAFAVWENVRKRLFLARDRIGVKPLFFKKHGRGFLFASEMKTILKYPDVKAQLDEEGAAQLIFLGPGRIPGSGVFYGLQEVEPGWCGYFEKEKLFLWQYWKLRDYEHTDTFAQTMEKVRWLVQDSIQRQMVSDVPIGTFLSGGLDSSIISAVCADEMKRKGERLHTFSLDYLNNDKYFEPNKFQPNADGMYIQIMQKELDTVHHWTVLTPEDLVQCIEDATIARDLPGMADVDFSLLAFCRNIKKEVKVALSGECADEIFGGYPWYRDPEVRTKSGFPWAQNTAERASVISSELLNRINPQEFVMDAYNKTCQESDLLPETTQQEQRMKEMVNLNFRWFMQTLLDRKDRMSMYCGLEVRVPFCDYRIAEYLYGIPWEFKDYQGQEKGLLRCAMDGLLPKEVLYRKKSPYPKTFDPEYERLVSDRLERIMQDKQSPLFHMVNKHALKAVVTENTQWPWYGQLMRRPQTIAYFLQLDFWLRHYQVEFLF